jgi:hypothetical protein
MKHDLLLDTQAFLWFWWDDPQLSAVAEGKRGRKGLREFLEKIHALPVGTSPFARLWFALWSQR